MSSAGYTSWAAINLRRGPLFALGTERTNKGRIEAQHVENGRRVNKIILQGHLLQRHRLSGKRRVRWQRRKKLQTVLNRN